MSVGTERKAYRSPEYKLLAFFEKSRNRWKAKCLAEKRKSKALTNNVAALRKSRERWKGIARQHRDEVQQLRRELEEVKNRLP